MASSPSPYAAPNTPIASAKRPRFAKKDMRSPMRPLYTGGDTKASDKQSANDLKHKDNNCGGEEKTSGTRSKALFSPSPHADAGGSSGTSHFAHDAEAAAMSASSEFDGERDSTPVASRYSDTYDGEAGEEEENKTYLVSRKPAGTGSGGATEGNASQDEEAKKAQREKENSAKEKEQEQGAEGAKDEGEEEEEEEGIFNPYQFMAGLPPVEQIQRNPVSLPPSSTPDKPTLVLDLDETLVHCSVEPVDKPDMKFPVTFNGVLYDVYVRKRPYLDYFLEAVSRTFEVVVFTASQKVYADQLLDILDPEKKYIKHRLFREACVLVQGNYLKDLHVCGRDYKSTVLVDNSPHAYGFQIENGIPIESWFDDDADTELLKLVGFLRKAFVGEDVRPIIKEHFKTHELIEKAEKGIWVDCQSAPPL